MTPKFHEIVRDEYLDRILMYAKVLIEVENIIEELIEDINADATGLSLKIEGIYTDRIDNVVKVYTNLDKRCSLEKKVDNISIEIECKNVYPNSNEVYISLIVELMRLAIKFLKPYINRNKEYMLITILGSKTSGTLVLEGEEKNIVIPYIPGTIFICHTHPKTYSAIFSKNDILSLLDILSNQGFGSCVITPSTQLTIYRYRPFVIEDYYKLFRIAKEYEYLDHVLFHRIGFSSLESIYSII
ncbi:MAG: hypothetical protein QW101_03675 [Ignisphaera sp.]|uniref:Uncharacterized protein n=1 Tax=Ignisphaera aggregans TaxID=334771 RepID=A0A7J3MZI3_9CREN